MGHRIRQWIGYIIVLAGVLVLASPFVTGAMDQKKQHEAVASFQERITDTDVNTESFGEAEMETDGLQGSDEMKQSIAMPAADDAFFQAAREYNERLFAEKQKDLISTAATEHFPLDARSFGQRENMIGTIWIPRMEVELGLYLGASSEQMAKGAAIFGQTSLPLGLGNENVSIAGHRGWRGTPVFRDIQKLQTEDEVFISTKWATLKYAVSELRIVTPEDNSWCRIVEGENLITLMTCHPYTKHYQRYVVFAKLKEVLPPGALDDGIRRDAEMLAETTEDDSPKTVQVYDTNGESAKTLVDSTSIATDGSEYGSVWSNGLILAENTIRIITMVLGAGVLILGIWLFAATRKDWKDSKD